MNEEIPRTAKVVSPVSGNYERNKEKQRLPKGYPISGNVFGLAEIFKVVSDSDMGHLRRGQFISLEGLINNPDVLKIPKMQELLQDLRKDLTQKAKSRFHVGAIRHFFVQFAADHATSYDIQISHGNQFVAVIDSIDDQMLFDMIINHAVLYGQRLEYFRAREKSFRKNFLRNLNRVVETGVLEIDLASVKKKMDNYSVHIQDFLKADIEEHDDGIVTFIPGTTEHESDIVNLSMSMSDEKAERVYTHEMFHVVSGDTSVLFNDADQGESIDPVSGLVRSTGFIKRYRSGFGIGYQSADLKLAWLNEATTEDLTTLLISEDDHDNTNTGTYLKERELLAQLLKRGRKLIPRKLLYDAYLSDSVDGKDENAPTPALERFYDAIDTAYGSKGFLFRLDEYVNKHSLDKAIEALKNEPNVILKG